MSIIGHRPPLVREDLSVTKIMYGNIVARDKSFPHFSIPHVLFSTYFETFRRWRDGLCCFITSCSTRCNNARPTAEDENNFCCDKKKNGNVGKNNWIHDERTYTNIRQAIKLEYCARLDKRYLIQNNTMHTTCKRDKDVQTSGQYYYAIFWPVVRT